jgi:transposase, IS5 family
MPSAKIAAQSRQRLAGTTPAGATRRVSLHDPDARPIAKGRLGKPVEFGYNAQVADNDDGVVLDHTVELGNRADASQLKPAVERVIKRTSRQPRTVTADRGYGEQGVDDALHYLGVHNVVIPRKGRPTKARQAVEHRRAFRRTIKWRTGCEGRISTLKRGYGWDRSRTDTLEGARTWVGHGVLIHNLVKIAAGLCAQAFQLANRAAQPSTPFLRSN